ncbi:MAG TPA: FAD-dependent oxidoreductase, partial [Blastocatellia bacterium]|nr:FAD-dependent oxidoreductase [Blastocatellia bacterium]
MSKKKFVVIGNGMAGARLVEDIIARGGAEQFDFVMFGDEPYGNYNRILLSGVLSGTHNPQDIFINSLAWYKENNVKLHAGVRVASIDRELKLVTGTDGTVEAYDCLAIATGSSPFVPPMEGLYRECGLGIADCGILNTGNSASQTTKLAGNNFQSAIPNPQSAFKDGVFVFRTLDDCSAITNYAQGGKRAAVI